MRYYDIVFSNIGANTPLGQATGGTLRWATHPNGIMAPPDPGALEVHFDLLAYELMPGGQPDASSGVNAQDWVRIMGIPLSVIGQANNLSGATVAIYGGMGKGLPLANPAQAGLLIQGMVWNPFANWIGTAMTLEFFVTIAPFQVNSGSVTPTHIPFQWRAGGALPAAIQNAIANSYPQLKPDINISPNLTLNHDEIGIYRTLPQFATMLRRITRPILGGSYQGVSMSTTDGTTLRVYDGTTPPAAKVIYYQDLVGQPTWLGLDTIQVTTVLRADLQVGDVVTLPNTLTTQTPSGVAGQGAQAPGIASLIRSPNGNIQFSGQWTIRKIRHTGQSRSPNALDWVTQYEMTYNAGAQQ